VAEQSEPRADTPPRRFVPTPFSKRQETLDFVKNNPLLKQIPFRKPGKSKSRNKISPSDDGIFPKIKALDENWTKQELFECIDRHNDLETIEDIIDHLPQRFEAAVNSLELFNQAKQMTFELATVIFDRDLRLVKKLHETLIEINHKIMSVDLHQKYGEQAEVLDSRILNVLA